MIIRSARATDIPDLTAWLSAAWRQSKYGDRPFNANRTKARLVALITMPEDYCVYLAEQDGVIHGMFIGGIDRILGISDDGVASDLLWIVPEAAPAGTAMALLEVFHAWAWAHPRVTRIQQGLSDTLAPISRGASRALERRGFKLSAIVYEKERPE